MGFIDDNQGIVGQVLEQRRRRLSRGAPRQVARVVLDAGAIAQLADHLDIVPGALLQALRFDQFIILLELLESLGQFLLDVLHRTQQDIARGYIVALGKYGDSRHFVFYRPGQRIEPVDTVYLFIEQFHPDSFPL